MSKRTIGLPCDPVTVEVCFSKETIRERARDTGSPALVPLAVVMKIVEQYQRDALRYRWLRDGPGDRQNHRTYSDMRKLFVQHPDSVLYAVKAARGEELDKLVDEEQLNHEFSYQAGEYQVEFGQFSLTAKLKTAMELKVIEDFGLKHAVPYDWEAEEQGETQ